MTFSDLTRKVKENGSASQNHCGAQINKAIRIMVKTRKSTQLSMLEDLSVFILSIFLFANLETPAKIDKHFC